MLEEFVDKLMEEVHSILKLHQVQSNLLKYYSIQASLFSTAMTKLNEKIADYNFQSIEEEINFFKNTKPKLIAEQHYSYSRIRSLRHCQNLSKDAKEEYIKNELLRIDKFFLEHKDFCSYISVGEVHFDEDYFTRLCKNSMPTVDYYLSDKNFRTTCKKAYIIGKMISKKRLSIYFQSLLENEPDKPAPNGHILIKTQNWNASHTDLVELFYALKAAGCLNGSISNISEAFTQFFGIDSIDTYKTWSRIRGRKSNPTRLISKLLEALSKQIKEENEE